MASSRKISADLTQLVRARLAAAVPPNSRVCVGLSGGRDSVVLLHAIVQRRAELDVALSAIHVNHQISPHAEKWAGFCADLCATLAAPLTIERVTVPRDGGKGLEAAARDARYGAFAALDTDAIVLAHHLDDQAETVLLQAFRGAGLKGISGMPAVKLLRNTGQKLIVRPLLDIESDTLAAYAVQHQLAWIEDESNDDTRYFRNHLRHEVLPRIAVHAPHYRASLMRLAKHAADAQQLLDELAHIDSKSVVEREHLKLAPLLALSDPRAKNLLRYFFSQTGIAVPNAVQLHEMLQRLRSRQTDDQTEITWANRLLRCFAGLIQIDIAADHAIEDWRISWRGETELVLPQGCGLLRLEPGMGHGIDRSRISGEAMTIRSRVGGERLRPDASRPRRTLKNLLQEARIPPWERARMPLLFCGESLVWVPEIGVDAGFAAGPNQDSISITWQPHQTGMPQSTAPPSR